MEKQSAVFILNILKGKINLYEGKIISWFFFTK